MIEPKRTVAVEPVNPSSPSLAPDLLAFWNGVPMVVVDKDERSALDRAAESPCRSVIGTTTFCSLSNYLAQPFDNRDLGRPAHDHCLTNSRSVQLFRYGNIQTRRALRQGLDQRPGPDRREPATALAGGRRTAWGDGSWQSTDEGVSGARWRDKRPGLDALLKGVARREFDVVAAWSGCRLGRSLSDLVGLLVHLRLDHHAAQVLTRDGAIRPSLGRPPEL